MRTIRQKNINEASITITHTQKNGAVTMLIIRDQEWLKDPQKMLQKVFEKINIKSIRARNLNYSIGTKDRAINEWAARSPDRQEESLEQFCRKENLDI